ncbi:hypothetical protein AGMMS50267_00670 [Spirochaetia bacterium]|nr:hypothetical protein AGMMS50267_00670 [Spirochaetia bacterium]
MKRSLLIRGLTVLLTALLTAVLLPGCGGLGEDPEGGPTGPVGNEGPGTPAGDGDFVVYSDGKFAALDFSRPGDQGFQIWEGMKIAQKSTAAGGHSGTMALEFDCSTGSNGGGGLGIYVKDAIDLAAMDHMSLWVKNPNEYEIKIGPISPRDSGAEGSFTIPANSGWQELKLHTGNAAPKLTIDGAEVVSPVTKAVFSIWITKKAEGGMIYIDDIKFIKKAD